MLFLRNQLFVSTNMLMSAVGSCTTPPFIHEDGKEEAPRCTCNQSIFHHALPRVQENLMGTMRWVQCNTMTPKKTCWHWQEEKTRPLVSLERWSALCVKSGVNMRKNFTYHKTHFKLHELAWKLRLSIAIIMQHFLLELLKGTMGNRVLLGAWD